MNNVDYFRKYIPKDKNEVKINRDVWSYTRVSSKEQFEKNSSVERQIEANTAYAGKYNYQITQEFGGTYESAKSDFTRKEFKRLIDKVTDSRKKPFAILVYKMSRFSRSGGNAIGLVHALVDELGVHLIEVCSGITTTTERGKAAIYESLFHAYKENLEKKEIIIPSMVAFLKQGNWCGPCPTGYDHYGPRVKKEKFMAPRPRWEVNKEGELLKEAWQWKASGLYSDVEILAKLSARGLELSPQTISKMWRNPFFCGILINKMLDEPVQGIWPPLVSKEDFIKVQDILGGIKVGCRPGYTHDKEVEPRPLTRLLRCDACKRYMVGYKNKKKDLHYYKCQYCNGVHLNAHTTPYARRKGANELFTELLDRYRLPDGIEPLVTLQLKKIFHHLNDTSSASNVSLESQLKVLEKNMKDLRIRHGLGEIDKETFDLAFAHLNEKLRETSKELNKMIPRISDLDKLLIKSPAMIGKLSGVWVSSDLESKRRIQKALFPEGIFYDPKNHQYQYLTNKQNENVFL